MLLNPGHTEVVRGPTHGDDEGVVTECARWRHLDALFIDNGGQSDLLAGAIETIQAPQTEAEVVGARLSQKLDRVCVGVERPRRNLVQERLPQVRQRSVDKRDLGLTTASQCLAKPNSEFEAAGPAADDDDAVLRHAEI